MPFVLGLEPADSRDSDENGEGSVYQFTFHFTYLSFVLFVVVMFLFFGAIS